MARRHEWQATALIVAFCSAAALGAGLVIGRAQSAPSDLTQTTNLTTFPLTSEQIDDARTVTVEVQSAPGGALTANTAGRVTATFCRPGMEVVSGTAYLAVDGKPLVALSTTVPMWRDLVIGDKGADVAAIQTELLRLGATGFEANGTLNRVTWDALQVLMGRSGGSLPARTVPLASFVWLPASTVTLTDCPIALNAAVAPGMPVATLAPVVTGFRVSPLPTGVPGPRLLEVSAAAAPVDGTGVISDPAVVSAFTATDAVQVALANGTEQSVPGTWRLATAIMVYPVPPGALVMRNTSEGCVQDGTDGAAIAAHVVTTQLGRTYLQFPGGSAPSSIMLVPGKDLVCA